MGCYATWRQAGYRTPKAPPVADPLPAPLRLSRWLSDHVLHAGAMVSVLLLGAFAFAILYHGEYLVPGCGALTPPCRYKCTLQHCTCMARAWSWACVGGGCPASPLLRFDSCTLDVSAPCVSSVRADSFVASSWIWLSFNLRE